MYPFYPYNNLDEGFATLKTILSKLNTNESDDESRALSVLERLFKEGAENLIGDLIRHPEHAKIYRKLGQRLKKIDENLFRKFQFSLGSIQRVAFLLRKDKPKELDSFTQWITRNQENIEGSIFPNSIVLDFVNLHLPIDIEKVRNIADPEVRTRVIAKLINRDQDIRNLDPASCELTVDSEMRMTITHMREIIKAFIQHSVHTIDYEMFEKIDETYTKAKELLKTPNLPVSIEIELTNILAQINNFEVARELLKKLRVLDEYIRTATPELLEVQWGRHPLGVDLSRFQSLIGLESWKDIHLATDSYDKQIKWEKIRRNVFQAARECASVPLELRRIRWITGNRSEAIIGMEAVAQLGILKLPALVPTGQLLKHNIVPLTGYLGSNMEAANKESLSGMHLSGLETCLSYAEGRQFCSFNSEREIDYIRRFEYNTMYPELFNDDQYFRKAKFDLTRVKVAVMRIILMNKHPDLWDELCKHIKNKILPIVKKQSPLEVDRVIDIIGLFNTVRPLNLSHEAQSLVDYPFPIVWGSCTLDSSLNWALGVEGERIVKGIAELGKDIQIAFTDSEHIEILKRTIEKYNIRVFSFDVAKSLMRWF